MSTDLCLLAVLLVWAIRRLAKFGARVAERLAPVSKLAALWQALREPWTAV